MSMRKTIGRKITPRLIDIFKTLKSKDTEKNFSYPIAEIIKYTPSYAQVIQYPMDFLIIQVTIVANALP